MGVKAKGNGGERAGVKERTKKDKRWREKEEWSVRQVSQRRENQLVHDDEVCQEQR